jgi:hypothetical protein
MALLDLLMEQLEKTEDFTERLALKVAAGILIQRNDIQGPVDPRIRFAEDEWEWTPEKIELMHGVIPWPTPEDHAASYDMLEQYIAADPDQKKEIRRTLLDPTKEMLAVQDRKYEEWRAGRRIKMS